MKHFIWALLQWAAEVLRCGSDQLRKRMATLQLGIYQPFPCFPHDGIHTSSPLRSPRNMRGCLCLEHVCRVQPPRDDLVPCPMRYQTRHAQPSAPRGSSAAAAKERRKASRATTSPVSRSRRAWRFLGLSPEWAGPKGTRSKIRKVSSAAQ